MSLSRRSLLKTALAGSALVPAAALTAQAQAPAVDAAAYARQALSDNAKSLAAVQLPQATEPAFVFRP